MSAAAELLLASPAARPCVHRRAHRHGTRQRYAQDRCRCLRCRVAASAYQAERDQAIAHGRWLAFADARPVRAHVLALLDAGMSRQGIAKRAHVSSETVRRILDTDARRMRRRTATALLALGIGRRRPANQGGLWDG